tara:strand:+ start:680 stop:2389 length:1710 start_codon:yes stop_codon:yes gene_type:complete
MSSFLRQLGFQQKGNFQTNPSSGVNIYRDRSGQRMFSAPFLQNPQPFNGNFASQAGLRPPQASTPSTTNSVSNANSGITVTGGNTQPASQPAPQPTASQPAAPAFDMAAFLQAQQDAANAAAERAEQQAQQRLEQELRGQAGMLSGMSAGFGINDTSQINAALGQLRGLQGQAAASGVSLPDVASSISQLEGLLSQRTAEQGRYQDFVNQFNTAARQAGNYGVNDVDAINSAMQQFQDYQSGATGFSSPLNVDTSFVAPRSQSAMDQLQRTLDERERQLGVVSDTRSQLEDFIGNFGDAYNAVDFRNADQISALERGLDPITTGTIDGIDVDFDFSDLAGQTAGFTDMIGNLRERRGRELDTFGGDVTDFSTSLGGIDAEGDDFSANQVYGARDDFLGLQRELGNFGSGDRVNTFREQLFGLDEQYAGLSDALRDRQEGVESNAQAFVDSLMGGQFTDINQLSAEEARLAELRANRGRFDAFQSDDELSRAQQFLGDTRGRLQAEALARQQQAERDRMLGGNTVMTPAFARQFMNDAEYQAFLASLEQAREGQDSGAQATAFARSLGLA